MMVLVASLMLPLPRYGCDACRSSSALLNELLAIAVAASIVGLAASVVMAWASNRSALFNMAFGGLLAVAVLAGGVLIAYLLTRVAYPN
jgi:ABC-type Mn2+/Zn2+ transport system permease subunit